MTSSPKGLRDMSDDELIAFVSQGWDHEDWMRTHPISSSVNDDAGFIMICSPRLGGSCSVFFALSTLGGYKGQRVMYNGCMSKCTAFRTKHLISHIKTFLSAEAVIRKRAAHVKCQHY